VDSVVSAFLGGNVSPDTREILLRGENPLVAKLGADNATPAAAAPGMPLTPAGPGMPLGMPPGMQAFARPVQLQGIAQIVGLAIGAPEFQRR
jgi:hypothetical protein